MELKRERFTQMRKEACRFNKIVPAFELLESLWNDCGGVCIVCHQAMNWKMADGASTCVTLQHDRDGTIRLLCHRCNCRHGNYEGDSFYTMDLTKKTCTVCKQNMPLSHFYKRSNHYGVRSWCKTCDNADSAKREKTRKRKKQVG